jgi:hypothetical protein
MATWNEMTEAERARIDAEEDARENRKASFAGADEYFEAMEGAPVLDALTDAEIDDMAARHEEYQGGHKDHFYW